MASPTTASTTVGFSEDSKAKRLVLENDNSIGLLETLGATYVRVFPSSAHPKVTAVVGLCTKLATNLPLEVVDYVSFNGSSSSSLKYEPGSTVSISEAHFYKANPTVAYDVDTNSVVLSQEAHGLVKVSYTAYFDRYIVSHGDAPCKAASTQTMGGVPPVRKDSPNYETAFLVAEAAYYEMASLEVTGPACFVDKANDHQYDNYEAVGLRLETDVAIPPGIYPFYFNTNDTPLGFTLRPQVAVIGGIYYELYCGCRVRVYPAVPVTISGVNCSVSSTSVGRGSKPVRQAISFSGAQSANLEYPPEGKVQIVQVSANALSVFGGKVSVRFAGPGEWVNEVKWLTSTTFEMIQGRRVVRDDEVVVVTALGTNTIPCYTFAEAGYTSDYYLFDVLFNWDAAIGWYGPAMVLAVDGQGRMGSLQINPPAKQGVL